MNFLRKLISIGYTTARLSYNPELRQALAWFKANDKRDRETLRFWQMHQLSSILTHSGNFVHYYREMFARLGFDMSQTVSPAMFAALPLLTKQDIRENLEALVQDNIPKARLIRSGTGGSTGAPVPFYRDVSYMRTAAALKWRNLMWTGWRLGDARVKIWGSAFDVKHSSYLLDRMIRWFSNEETYPAFEMSEDNMQKWFRRICNIRPAFIEGYTNPLVGFACYVQENQGRLDNLGIKGVINAAETLYESQRRCLEDVFGCRVFNRYGGRELSDIAHECQHGTLHICDDWVYVEVVDDKGWPVQPGVSGQIVLTGLHNKSMPFIRYAVEDVGALMPDDFVCPCGLPFRSLARLEGRIQDLIVLPGGGYVAGEIFPHLFKDFDIEHFQVIQYTEHTVEVKIVAGVQFNNDNQRYILEKLQTYLPQVDIKLNLVEDIPLSASGKFRFTVSHVAGAQALRQPMNLGN